MNWTSALNIMSAQRGRLKNLAVLLSSNFFAVGVGFLTTVVIANSIGSAGFGELAYAYAIGGILAVNVRFGMDRSLIRDLTHFPERFGEFLAASVLLRTMILLVVVFGVLLLKAMAVDAVGLPLGSLLVVFAATLAPLQLTNFFDVLERQGRHALYSAAERSVYFVLVWSVILLKPEMLSILWIGSALLVSTTLFLFLQYRYAWKHLKSSLLALSLGNVLRTSLAMTRSYKWLWLASLAGLGLTAVNKVVLKEVSGFSDLGVYAVSWQLMSLGMMLLKNVSRIGKPIMARQASPNVVVSGGNARFLSLYLLVMSATASVIALPAIAFPQFILQTLFSPEYASGYWTLRILGCYLFVHAIAIVFDQYVYLTRMDRLFLATKILAGSVAIASCAILIPRYAATGAALSVLIGAMTGTGLSIIVSMSRMSGLCGISLAAKHGTELLDGDHF